MSKFNSKDKVIYDSGFGYDIGYYVDYSTIEYDSVTLLMATGISAGHEILVNRNTVIPYSKEKIKELTKIYGYEKSFSEEF